MGREFARANSSVHSARANSSVHSARANSSATLTVQLDPAHGMSRRRLRPLPHRVAVAMPSPLAELLVEHDLSAGLWELLEADEVVSLAQATKALRSALRLKARVLVKLWRAAKRFNEGNSILSSLARMSSLCPSATRRLMCRACRLGVDWDGDECNQAVCVNNIDTLEWLLQIGCPMHTKTVSIAAGYGRLAMVELLVRHGAVITGVVRPAICTYALHVALFILKEHAAKLSTEDRSFLHECALDHIAKDNGLKRHVAKAALEMQHVNSRDWSCRSDSYTEVKFKEFFVRTADDALDNSISALRALPALVKAIESLAPPESVPPTDPHALNGEMDEESDEEDTDDDGPTGELLSQLPVMVPADL